MGIFPAMCVDDNDKSTAFRSSAIYKAFSENIKNGLVRPLITLPFDVVTLARQITGNSYADILTGINKSDMPRFSKIFKVHAVQSWLKAGSVYPIYAYVTDQMNDLFPERVEKYPILPNAAAVASIALTDVFYINQLERLKVCFMNNNAIPFYRHGKINWSELLRSREWLFTGGTLTFQSTSIHLSAFLTLNHVLKKILFAENEVFTLMKAGILGMSIAMIQTSITFPLLTLRARLHAERLKCGKNISVLNYVETLYQTKQLSCLYHGWRMRVIRASLIAIADAYWLNNRKKT